MSTASIDIARFSSDAKRLIRELERVSANINKDSDAIFEKASVPLREAIQARAPQSESAHSRYKGGSVVATYEPGNLRRSYNKTLRFGSRKGTVWIAPKIEKGGGEGRFSGARASGYYAHYLEFGTAHMAARPFVRPAFEATKDLVAKIAIGQIQLILKKHDSRV